MDNPTTRHAETSVRCLPLLVLLFVGSGCAALIYEIVWLQLLQLVIGSSAVSLGVLLGTFMGGMCLGSLLLPRMVRSDRHPLRVYAALEIGIAVLGIALIFGLPQIDNFYAAIGTHGWLGLAMRASIAAICLLPPTLLMGATLPAVARWVEATPRGIAWLGFFYGGNIAGAVFGCLLASFYLLRLYDMQVATFVAVSINVAVALIALAVAARAPAAVAAGQEVAAANTRQPLNLGIYLAIGLSGLAALGAEVVWTRLLSLLLGGTVYTFSIILAVFLTGLGIGSTVGAWLAKDYKPRLLLGLCQLLLALAIFWAAFQLTQSLPYWPIDPSLAKSPWHAFQLDLVRCLWAVLPATCLWGASFPWALAAAHRSSGRPQRESRAPTRSVGRREVSNSRSEMPSMPSDTPTLTHDPGKLVGGVYAANTVGAIIGALGFSVLVVGTAGTQIAQQILIVICAAAALSALVPLLWSSEAPDESAAEQRPTPTPAAAAGRTAALAACLAVVAFVAWRVPKTPGELIAYGRYVPRDMGSGMIAYQGEGLNSSVAVTYLDGGVRNFHVSGKIEASSEPQDMRLQRMLGHIPALVHPAPKSVLVVGCGAGVTAGSFLVHPSVERIVVCEIEPLIPQVVAEHFAPENYDLVHSPKVTIVFDDARHYILTTRETFDVITSDPIHPWVKGAATLYTREYFELCRKRLNPGGVVTQWVPLYESNESAVKSELATFFEAFPAGTIWSNDQEGRGYDIVLLGHEKPLTIDIDKLVERMGSPGHRPVARSLSEVGFLGGLDLLATYAGTASDLAPWLADAQINRDRNLRLQYLAGMGSSRYQEILIYNEMLKYRKFPEQLFVASVASREELRRKLGLAP
jgi:spermidine synthase